MPQGRRLTAVAGTPLQEVLFEEGVEFPCGGRGKCRGCRIRILAGHGPQTADDLDRFTPQELAEGWRLACRTRADGDLKIELAQWEASILTDARRFEFRSQPGLGVAVDLGTTTLVAQLLDLGTGEVLAVRAALNHQARLGADIMSRIEFAMTAAGATELRTLVRQQIAAMIREMVEEARDTARQGGHPVPSAAPGEAGAGLRQVVIVGNTVMHHLFCGVDATPLAHHPFESEGDGLQVFTADGLGWEFADGAEVRFLPCLGGFVGSDILAGILATEVHESADIVALVDLGTNGELVVGNREGMLCASTAAGPAFEGARISMGMRAATGAISAVAVENAAFRCEVLGHGVPRGICGSGLVDAVASALDLGWVQPNGRLAGAAREIPLAPPVSLSAADIRELQLAKGAIAAGLRLLARQRGTRIEEVSRIHLAGAFGNYINRASARRIGLLPFGPERVVPAGNAALLGAKLALCGGHEGDGHFAELRARIRHVSLSDDPEFQDTYAGEMGFPCAA